MDTRALRTTKPQARGKQSREHRKDGDAGVEGEGAMSAVRDSTASIEMMGHQSAGARGMGEGSDGEWTLRSCRRGGHWVLGMTRTLVLGVMRLLVLMLGATYIAIAGDRHIGVGGGGDEAIGIREGGMTRPLAWGGDEAIDIRGEGHCHGGDKGINSGVTRALELGGDKGIDGGG
ncbi:hypothetical protein OF83DRAFT_1085439 [Amylostereum chailletii]|nr:hypothetical protein OF83DRAFT_1085439 [Amylostereum chailletii]